MSSKSLWTKYVFVAVTLLLPPIAAQAQATGDRVLARIGNQTITETDLREISSTLPDYMGQTPEAQDRALEDLVNIYVIAAEAEAQGLDKDPDVQRMMKLSRKTLLTRAYLDRMVKNLPQPTEADAKAFFEKNKAQFTEPEAVLLRHILVKTDKEAKDALDKLKKGEKFDTLAAQVSQCPSKVKGGSLGWRPKGSLGAEIDGIVAALKKGQLGGPVQTRFGWHVVLLEDSKPAEEASFDQIKDQIIERLRMQAQQDEYEKLAESLRKKMNVQLTAPAEKQSTAPLPPAGPTAGPKN